MELSGFDSCENPLFHKIRKKSAEEGKTARGLEVGLSRRRAGSTDLDINKDTGVNGGSTTRLANLAGLESCTVDKAGNSDGDGSDDGVVNVVNVDVSEVADTHHNDYSGSHRNEDSGEGGHHGDVVDCQNPIDETGAEEQPQEAEPTLHRDAERGRRYSHNTRSGGETARVDAAKMATVKAAPVGRRAKRFDTRKESFEMPTSATGSFLARQRNWTQYQARRARRGSASQLQPQTVAQVADSKNQIEVPVSQETVIDRDDSGRAGGIEL